MHNNFYLLRQLSIRLEEALPGSTFTSCFSQEKDELLVGLSNSERTMFIRCSLQPDLQCLSFPATFRRARKNSIDLFPELSMKTVTGVHQFANERSLGLKFGSDWTLVFKMHGKQANVILFRKDAVHSVFRNHLLADKKLRPEDLEREIDWTREAFMTDPARARTRFVTFGKQVWNHLTKRGFDMASPGAQWDMLQETKHRLEKPRYTIVEDAGTLHLSLLNPGEGHSFQDPLEALTVFFQQYKSSSAFNREKAALLSAVRARIRQCSNYLHHTRLRLAQLETDQHYTQWADLVMVNLHRLTPGLSEAELEDFRQPGRMITVKLKKEMSPQKNAEVFYRKAKNQAIEKQKLHEALQIKGKELATWVDQEGDLLHSRNIDDLQSVAPLVNRHEKGQEARSMPYREHVHGGYTIRIGKHAAGNDELTLHHSHKEDLWLHARDVAGSHVVVKHRPGKPFPKAVIDYAASLAAWHSKRRNDSLCPVAVTLVKHVRKRKGDPPGAVVVQREKVVMAEPISGQKRT